MFGIDLDGVVWNGKNAVTGAPEAIQTLRHYGQVVFATNNSAMTATQLRTKLKTMGIEASESSIYTSAYSAIQHCLDQAYTTVHVIAPQEMLNEYKKRNIPLNLDTLNPEALVLHFSKEFDYTKLTKAVRALIAGARFITCNLERVFPGDDGPMPGLGGYAAAISFASKCEPFVCGKPSREFIQQILQAEKCNAQNFIMIGDSIESDIQMGQNCGTKTVLIESSSSLLTAGDTRPDVQYASLSDFAVAYKQLHTT